MRQTPLEKIIQYTFKDRELFNQAVTHSSVFNERKETRHSDNEQLEYLGDAILNTVISIFLYKQYKKRDEGFLSNARSSLVKRETLTEVAKKINLGKHMSYGNGGGTVPEESKVLSNMLEALIGAIYLDGGMRKVTKVIKDSFSALFQRRKTDRKKPEKYTPGIFSKKVGTSAEI